MDTLIEICNLSWLKHEDIEKHERAIKETRVKNQ